MTYRQWLVARQLLAEEHLGVYARAKPREEDALFAASVTAARRSS